MEFIQLLNLAEKFLAEKTYNLLELNYSSETFGSGYIQYKLRSKYVMIALDGKEQKLEIFVANTYTMFKAGDWKSVHCGSIRSVKEDMPRVLNSIYQP